MKTISWNIRGINSPIKHSMIKKKIQQENPTILMLQETKTSSSKIESLMSKLWCGSQTISLDSSRASGGFSISWNPKEITHETDIVSFFEDILTEDDQNRA